MAIKYVLSFETSGKIGGCAIINAAGDILHEVILGDQLRHGQTLAPAAKECLDVVGGNDIDGLAVAVDVGPGSYTGLRVGVMTAKAFAFGRGVPIIGVKSLDAMAYPYTEEHNLISVANIARKNEIYYCEYHQDNDNEPEIFAVSFDEAKQKIQSLPEAALVLGNAYTELFGEESANSITVVNYDVPAPVNIAKLGLELFSGNCDGDNLHAMQPVYPRRAGVNMPVLGEPLESK